MANEIDMWQDLEEAEAFGDRQQYKKIVKQLRHNYPELKLNKLKGG